MLLHFVIILLQLNLIISYTLETPLVIFGVDGYGFELYKEYGNKKNGALNVIPLQTVYPSKTFPNFYSIATGLYPTQHGIISNKFLNKKQNKVFSYENDQADGFDWYKGEPIWITAKKAGLRVYADMWVGTAAQYGGIRPDIYSVYNGSKTIEDKVSDLVSNMNSPNRCDLYIFYTNEPDFKLHRNDMTNKTLAQSIINEGERRISLLTTALASKSVNLVVVSDHGLMSYSSKYDFSKDMESWAREFYGGPYAVWYTDKETPDQIPDLLYDINKYMNRSHMAGAKAYRPSDLPRRLQLCGLEDEGMPEIVIFLDEKVALGAYSTQMSGHGWDNISPHMFGQMRVSGPGFRKIPFVEQMNATMNTELYNMFVSLLGITPANNTGHLDTFDFMLSSPPNRSTWNYERVQEPCFSLSAGDPVYYGGVLFIVTLFLTVLV